MLQSSASLPPGYPIRGPTARRRGWAAPSLACLAALGMVIATAGGEPVTSDLPHFIPTGYHYIVIAQEPVRSDAEANRLGGAVGPAPVQPPVGSRIIVLDTLGSSLPSATNLTPGFAAAGQPDLSFDGKRILFTGKRSENGRFNVWEMNIDGTGLRQVTKEPVGCYTPVYLSTTFTLDAKMPVHQIAFSRVPEDEQVSSLYTCYMNGTRIMRITFNPYGASDPFLISDKRLLYTSWNAPVQTHNAAGGPVLMTVNPDGTDVFIFAAAGEVPAAYRMQCETTDGWMVYVESAMGESDSGGSLVAVARTRSLHTRRVIADDPNGLYRSASALDNGRLLVSYRSKLGGSYALYELDAQSGARVAAVFDAPEWHEVEGFVVRPRPEPAGHSSVVDERVNSGKLYCMDTYLSDTAESRRIGKGQIKKVRVIQAVLHTRAGQGDSPAQQDDSLDPALGVVREKMLGEAGIERDGSFFLEVPPRTPLRLETLDSEGKTLQAMTSWIWVMPQERRGCIGCHADRELTPPNRHVYALRKEPINLVAGSDAAVESHIQSDRGGGDPK